jgi:Methyltransferase domain
MAWREVGCQLLPPVLVRSLSRMMGYRTRPLPPMAGDGAMTRMRAIIPGWLPQGNLESFAYCLARLPSDAPIIEIGSFAGLSLNHLIHLLRRAGRQNPVFSVDPWKFESSDHAYRAHLIETFRLNVTLFSGGSLPHHIELDSDAFFTAWASNEQRVDFFGNAVQLGGPIAFAYIDGSHTYEQSTKDFKNVDRYLEPGGFVVFDDSADYYPSGSTCTAQDAAKLSTYEVVAKNPNYCLRKR